MIEAETRAVLTQDGEVRITFDEAGRNIIAGSPAAIRAFDRALLTQVNRYGIGVTLDSLQPDDLKFVAGQGSGLVLGDPPMLDEVDPPPMPSEADGTGVSLHGPDDAVAHIKHVMATACDHRGMTITADSVEPATCFDFCQPEGSGIVIMEPGDAGLAAAMVDKILDDECVDVFHPVDDDSEKVMGTAGVVPDKGGFIIPAAEIAPAFDSAGLQRNFAALSQETSEAARRLQALQCIRDELDR